MQVSVTANVIFDDRLGRLLKGQVVDMPDHKAKFFMARGDVELYLTKVMRDRPTLAAGSTEQSSAAPVAQALTETTSNESESGVQKKRGRPRKEQSL